MDETDERDSERPLSDAARRLEDNLAEWRGRLETVRDELRVQAHLGARELADRRERLDRERREWTQRLERAGFRAAEGASAIGGTLGEAWRRGLETFDSVRKELDRERR